MPDNQPGAMIMVSPAMMIPTIVVMSSVMPAVMVTNDDAGPAVMVMMSTFDDHGLCAGNSRRSDGNGRNRSKNVSKCFHRIFLLKLH